MVQTGDKVRFLNAVGGGKVIKVVKDIAYIEDEDGFEIPVLVKECVIVESHSALKSDVPKTVVSGPSILPMDEVEKDSPASTKEDDIRIIETQEGDILNIVLGFVPEEYKHLNTTRFDSYLVNDSNYYIYFTYLCREEQGWRTRYAGMVEPNIKLHLEEFGQENLNELERICIQYVAFKKDKHFTLKSPVTVEHRLDTVKFYKLHTFRENVYFDEPALVLDIVKNDTPLRPVVINAEDLERAMKAKKAVDKPLRQEIVKKTVNNGIIEVDLHINELLDNTAGLSHTDMLNIQLQKFREVMDKNKNTKGQKIVFIHGKGEGVLRNAIINEIKSKYKNCSYQDASFREYGFGATLVTIR